MHELSESLVLMPSNLTRLIDRMEEGGFVRREPCPGDRRGTYTVITREGTEALLSTIPRQRRRVEEHFLKYLNDKDLQALYRILSKVYAVEKFRDD